MRTDTIFYQLFQTFPSLLFELIGQSPDEASVYDFSSREIKELARRFDGLFLPTENTIEHPIYFVEVQFQQKLDFYWRFFTEIFVYLGQYKPANNWRAVALFANQNLDPGVPIQYHGLLLNQQVTIVYLDELTNLPQPSLPIGMVQLAIGTEAVAIERTNRLMQQARQELEDEALRRKVLELIETILVYKFIHLSREEIEAMFGLSDLKQTRVYQEGKQEGKLETVPLLLELGLSVEQIAERLGLEVEVVRRVAQTSTANTPQGENAGN